MARRRRGPAAEPSGQRAAARLPARLARLPLLGRFLGGDPLLRNGVLLTLASLATSVLGAAYWSLAGLRYDVATVGRNYSAISVMMFLAGAAQLNLADVLVRFVPAAGRRTRAVVGRAYAVTVLVALAGAAGFVLLVPELSPALMFLHGRVMGPLFVAATVAYSIFIVQDGALTGLRRPEWVLAENALFSVAKLAAVLVLAFFSARYGIMVSWAIALLVSLLFTNTYLFGFAIPGREREVRRFERRPSWARDPQPGDVTGVLVLPTERTEGMVRFTALTYAGGLFWLAATTLPQVLILNTRGARDSAYFSISWVITTMLLVISTNMGSSIVVESAGDLGRLGAAARTVIRSTGGLLAGAAAALCAGAPLVLRLFGPDYPAHASLLLRLLALSAVPNLITATALAAARVRRRAGMVVAVYAATAGLVLAFALAFVPLMGLDGMGLAWLVTQLLVAAALLVLRRGWLPSPASGPPPAPGPHERWDAAGSRPRPSWATAPCAGSPGPGPPGGGEPPGGAAAARSTGRAPSARGWAGKRREGKR